VLYLLEAAAAMAAVAMAAVAMAAVALAEALVGVFRADTRCGVLVPEAPSGSEQCLAPT